MIPPLCYLVADTCLAQHPETNVQLVVLSSGSDLEGVATALLRQSCVKRLHYSHGELNEGVPAAPRSDASAAGSKPEAAARYPQCLLGHGIQLVVLPDSTSNATLRRVAESIVYCATQDDGTDREAIFEGFVAGKEGVFCVEEGSSVKDRCQYYASGGVVIVTCRILCSDLLHRRLSHGLICDVVILLPQELSLSKGEFSTPSIAFVVEILLRGGGGSSDGGGLGDMRGGGTGGGATRSSVFLLSDHPYMIRFALQRRRLGQDPLTQQLHIGDIQVFPRFRLNVVQHFERVAVEKPLQVARIPAVVSPSTKMLHDLLREIRQEVLQELKSTERRLAMQQQPLLAQAAPSGDRLVGDGPCVRRRRVEARAAAVPRYVRKPWVTVGDGDAAAERGGGSAIRFTDITQDDLDRGHINGLETMLQMAMRSSNHTDGVWPYRKLTESLLDLQRLLRLLGVLSAPAFLLALEEAIMRRVSLNQFSSPPMNRVIQPDAPWTLSPSFSSVVVVAAHRAYRLTTIGALLSSLPLSRRVESDAPPTRTGRLTLGARDEATSCVYSNSEEGVHQPTTSHAATAWSDADVVEDCVMLDGAEEAVIVPNTEEVDAPLELLRSLVVSWCRSIRRRGRLPHRGPDPTSRERGASSPRRESEGICPSVILCTFSEELLRRLVTRLTHDLDDFMTIELNRFVAEYQAMYGVQIAGRRPATSTRVPQQLLPSKGIPVARTILFQNSEPRSADIAADVCASGDCAGDARTSNCRTSNRSGQVTRSEVHVERKRRGSNSSSHSLSSSSSNDVRRSRERHASRSTDAAALESPNRRFFSDEDQDSDEGAPGGGGMWSQRNWTSLASQGLCLSQVTVAASSGASKTSTAASTGQVHSTLLSQMPLQLPSTWRSQRLPSQVAEPVRSVPELHCQAVRPSESVAAACDITTITSDDESDRSSEDGDREIVVLAHGPSGQVEPRAAHQSGDVALSVESDADVVVEDHVSSVPGPAPKENPHVEENADAVMEADSLRFRLQSIGGGVAVLLAECAQADALAGFPVTPMAARAPRRYTCIAVVILLNGKSIGATELRMMVLGHHPVLRGISAYAGGAASPAADGAAAAPSAVQVRCERIVVCEDNLRFLRLIESVQDAVDPALARRLRIQVVWRSEGPSMRHQMVGEEREAFEGIVHIKALLTGELLFNRVSLQQTRELLDSGLVRHTRAGRRATHATLLAPSDAPTGASSRGPLIVFDEREFRSALPYALYCKGAELVPLTLTNGDYLLSPQYALERKSIPDFTQSLRSGRLHAQLSAMSRRFEHPMCLIEFDASAAFRLCHMSPWNSSSDISRMSDMYKRIAKLITSHPNVHMLWARSPAHAAGMLLTLKRTCATESVDTGNALLTTSALDGVEELGWHAGSGGVEAPATSAAGREAAIQAARILSRFPGVTPENAPKVMLVSGSLAGLATVSEQTLCGAIGEERGRQLYRFLHGPLFERVD